MHPYPENILKYLKLHFEIQFHDVNIVCDSLLKCMKERQQSNNAFSATASTKYIS